MKTFEEFKRSPELYGSEQIIQEDVLLYPAYVEYAKKETAKEILQIVDHYEHYTWNDFSDIIKDICKKYDIEVDE